MSQSLVQIYVHIVFSTKGRRAFLQDQQIRRETEGYLVGICRQQGCPSLQIGAVEDHVHILCRQGKAIDVAELVRELKRDSSKWLKTQSPALAEFHWQKGYGAFSISPSHIPQLRKYIANQEEHHRTESFQEEFRRLCKKYHLELDERYAWD
ncbi:MAG: IS200/IS605 family transposase [Planctomycetota bacterium]|nr:IS200/IS605 family transposase [Planctomycetota bacterium]